jgi:RNA polymerase sigma-70 factor (ECF subfamily)
MADDLTMLIAGCRRGDGIAQRQLYERFHRAVYRLAVRMAGRQEAADLTQEVFLRVFARISSFRGAAAFSTWLYRVTVNECLRYLRNRARRPETLVKEPPCLIPDGVHRLEQADLLERALTRLEGQLRAVFLLRECEGLTYAEIATILDIPTGTVASQLSRARGELQKFLQRVEQGHRDGV